MSLQMIRGKLGSARLSQMFFGLCWLAYVTTYLGRLNYSACLAEISVSEGWSKTEAGLIATGFFASYGFGQLLSGFLGDKISPKLLVGFGLAVSGLVNLLFPSMTSPTTCTALWCFNGFAQSLIWSPLIRLISERLSLEHRLKACVNMNTTVPIGTLAVYGMSAGLVFLGNWRLVFYASGTIMILVTVIWMLGMGYLDRRVTPEAVVQPGETGSQSTGAEGVQPSFWKLAIVSAIPLCMLAVLMQGMLKDGVTTWIPTFLKEQFNMASSGAILCTTVVPIVNLGGVYLAAWLDHRFIKNEVFSAALFFGFGILILLLLILVPQTSAVFSLLLLALITTSMMGVNALLVALMPPYYVNYGMTSTISGVLNSSAYVGCALSSYLNGAIVERYGWNAIMVCWLGCAVFGGVICCLAFGRWRQFRRTALNA